MTGLVGMYAHGNEPSHHIAYLYAYAGAPYKTQQRVRHLLDKLYDNQPDGLAGNEDCGQMSAWYVISALGFYAVDPASGNYVFGTPLFDRAVIDMGGGHRLVVEAKRKSDAGPVRAIDHFQRQAVRQNLVPSRRHRQRRIDRVHHGQPAEQAVRLRSRGRTPFHDQGLSLIKMNKRTVVIASCLAAALGTAGAQEKVTSPNGRHYGRHLH